jgi:hypothetical protein
MPDRSRKRPKDPNQLAKFVVDAATGAGEHGSMPPEDEGKNPAAVALGRLGGLKGATREQLLYRKKEPLKLQS